MSNRLTTCVAFLLLAVPRAAAQPDDPWPNEPTRRIDANEGRKDPKSPPPVCCLVFAPDSKVLAFSAGDLRLFDVAAGKTIRQLDRRVWWPISMTFCQGGAALAFIDRGQTVFFWKWQTDAEPTKFYEHAKAEGSLFYLAVREPGDALAVTELKNDQAYLWRDKDKPGDKVTLPADRNSPLRFVLKESALLAGYAVVDLASSKEVARVQDKEYRAATLADVLIPTYAITSADGQSLLLHTAQKVRFWNLKDGTLGREWSFAATRPAELNFLQNQRLALSPDGKRLAVSSDEKAVRIYDAASGKLLARLRANQGDHIYSLTFSPDGRLLASGGADGSILLWQLPLDR